MNIEILKYETGGVFTNCQLYIYPVIMGRATLDSWQLYGENDCVVNSFTQQNTYMSLQKLERWKLTLIITWYADIIYITDIKKNIQPTNLPRVIQNTYIVNRWTIVSIPYATYCTDYIFYISLNKCEHNVKLPVIWDAIGSRIMNYITHNGDLWEPFSQLNFTCSNVWYDHVKLPISRHVPISDTTRLIKRSSLQSQDDGVIAWLQKLIIPHGYKVLGFHQTCIVLKRKWEVSR